MLIPPFVAGMGAVGYGPALHLLPSTLAVLVGGRVEGLFLFANLQARRIVLVHPCGIVVRGPPEDEQVLYSLAPVEFFD